MTGGVLDSELYSVVYTSDAVRRFDDQALRTLLASARDFNRWHGVTGMLLYRAGRFVQFLEGPEHAVRGVMRKIVEDRRHANVRVLLEGHPEHRQFNDWTMGYRRLADESRPLPRGFRDAFDDLDGADDADAVVRAARELSLWFRIRASEASPLVGGALTGAVVL